MKYKRFKQARDENRTIAAERVRILDDMAKKMPQFADRYKRLANRIKQKYRLNDDSL